VPGNDAIVAVEQHRVGEPEFTHAAGDLRDLRVAVSSCIARVRDQRLDRAHHNLVGHRQGHADRLTVFDREERKVSSTIAGTGSVPPWDVVEGVTRYVP